MLTAGSTDRLLGSWSVAAQDPNDYYGSDGEIIANRGQWLYDNDAITHAIVETLLAGTIGPTGLQYRSAYQADNNRKVSDQELTVRRSIQDNIEAGTRGTAFDAGGMFSRANMSKVVLGSTINHGIGVSVYCWKPNRPGRHTHATCWRIVHPSRISNPNHAPNNHRMRDGFALDAEGTPVAVMIQRSHPASSQVAPKLIWDRYPIFDGEGFRRVTIHSLPRHADQIRPTGWFTPVMQLMRLMSRTIEAKVVADMLKASMGLICECDDPEAMAAADRNGAVLSGNTKIVPGKVYYVRKGTAWQALNFQYQGQDFDKWLEVILTNITAAFGLPYQFVLQKLTQANMASARVALLQAYRTFHSNQNDLITSTEDPWNQSLIREDLARGRIAGVNLNDPAEVDRLLVGTYLRPPRFMPDPLKEQQAAEVATKRNGVSYSTVYAEQGLDAAEEWAQREQDDAEMRRRGIVLQGDGSVMAPGPGQTPAADDRNDDDSNQDDQPSDQESAPRAEETQAAALREALGLARDAVNRPAPPVTVNLTVPPRASAKVVRDESGAVTGVTTEG